MSRRRDSVIEWISVEDRLPEIAKMVLVYTKNGVIDTAWRTGFSIPQGKWDTYSGAIYGNDKITHWMPLPEPPKEQKKRIKDHVCNNDYCELE